MTYSAPKHLHISCAIISYLLFLWRGILALRASPVMRQRRIKIAPHLIDAVLLISALALIFTIQQYPFSHAWLTAKLFALLLYIGLGSIALKYGKNQTMRITAWLSA